MPGRKERGAADVVARQREAADRLRREVLRTDGTLLNSYSRELARCARRDPEPASLASLVEECERAAVIYVGDFHAVPACQAFAADLLSRLAPAGPIALGVEFLYARQQPFVDLRQAGLLDDDTFLKRVHYREEWGYPWEGFRGLLDRAREAGAPVIALDAPPRAGIDRLTRRDEHAARRIAALLDHEPRTRLLVLFGESHVTPSHIPARVRRRLGSPAATMREVTILQDPDAAWWTFAARGEPPSPVARLGPGCFAVFHTPPLAKYEAYRQVLERWREDVPPDEEVDLTPAVHHLITTLLGWLGIDSRRFRVRHRAGWSEELADAFPEVYSGPEATELLGPILLEHGRSADEVAEARDLLRMRGALYEPRSNTFFLVRYLPGRAAGEGARFLRAVLSGRLFTPADETVADPVARAYGVAYNEALAYLGSRLVDPASDFLGAEDLEAMAAAQGIAREPVGGAIDRRIRWLEAHLRFEASNRLKPPEEIVRALSGPRELRRALARDLGHRLGRILFERVRSGVLRQRALRSLFSRNLEPSRAPRAVLALIRGTRGSHRA